MNSFTKISSVLFVSVLILCSCNYNDSDDTSLIGSWQSIGYGKIMVVDSSLYYTYDFTSISCTSVDTGYTSDLMLMSSLEEDTLSISIGYDIYQYVKSNKLSNICNTEFSDDYLESPVYNFDVVAKTFKENYLYFDLNDVDYDILYSKYRSKVDSLTTQVELYSVIKDFISDLKDNHGYIGPDDDTYAQYEKNESIVDDDEKIKLKEYGDFTIADLVTEHYLINDMTKDSWLIKWGKMENNIGYIQVKAMYLYGEFNLSQDRINEIGYVDTYFESFNRLNDLEKHNAEIEGINHILDRVMSDLYSTECIILDVRFNGGGSDEVGLEILKRFNPKKIQVASKRARHFDGFSKSIPIFLDGYADYYQNPVYVLTSQQSASATDFLAMATMAMGNIKRIGSHTNGALSDALERSLPNGWYLSLSNEEYLAINGVCYESKGISPNYELNYPEDRQDFFRSLADNLESDKIKVLKAISEIRDNY